MYVSQLQSTNNYNVTKTAFFGLNILQLHSFRPTSVQEKTFLHFFFFFHFSHLLILSSNVWLISLLERLASMH